MPTSTLIDLKRLFLWDDNGKEIAYDVVVNPEIKTALDSVPNMFIQSYPNNVLHYDGDSNTDRAIWTANYDTSPKNGDTLLTLYPVSDVSTMEIVPFSSGTFLIK